MEKILIVEDSKTFAGLVQRKIKNELNLQIYTADSLAQTAEILEREGNDFLAAVLDLHLPDAPDGEIVDHLLEKNIPSIVVTADIDDGTRENILSKRVVDYIIKSGRHSLDYLVKVIQRLSRNRYTKILVVDDSSVSRIQIRNILQVQQLQILEAQNGVEALEILQKEKEIKLVITDYHMPRMDGFQLVSEIRQKYSADKLAVIGISAHGNSILSAKLLKNGANDFVIKPFSEEEFICRVNQNLELLEYIQMISEAATKDHLTGLYNRRYLFELGEKLFQNAKRKNLNLTLCMLDIDFFKQINDKYGHHSGDMVLKNLATLLSHYFRASDVIARYGGEEFLILATNIMEDNCQPLFEKLREKVATTEFRTAKGEIKLTVSMGVITGLAETFAGMIDEADRLLYQAKREGRNRIVFNRR